MNTSQTDLRLGSTCNLCGSPSHKFCAKCKSVRYCSRNCQVLDWKGNHRKHCNKFQFSKQQDLNVAFARGCDETSNVKMVSLDCILDKVEWIGPDKLPHEGTMIEFKQCMTANGRHGGMRKSKKLSRKQREHSRQMGRDNKQQLYDTVIQHITTNSQWCILLSEQPSFLTADQNFGSIIYRVSPEKLLYGSGIKRWDLTVIYLAEFQNYHLFLSDHEDGIHKRFAGNYVCTPLTHFLGNPMRCVIQCVVDKAVKPLCVNWDNPLQSLH
jgi:hypothetical protein